LTIFNPPAAQDGYHMCTSAQSEANTQSRFGQAGSGAANSLALSKDDEDSAVVCFRNDRPKLLEF
jgi:hypothetical protein